MQNICYSSSKKFAEVIMYIIKVFFSSYESANWAPCFVSFLFSFLNDLVFIIVFILSYRFIYFYNLSQI